jgi:excinuclease UvrABC nuclease subunit
VHDGACPPDRTPSPRCRLLRVARIEALICDSAHEAAWAERNLLERSLPPWNLIVGGLEVPVSIRLDPSPEAPRLGLASADRPAPGVRCFGPYLGARKVRLAVSGLERLYLIGHAGPTCTAGEQETCSRSVPGTRAPDGWLPFLRRNAELAARLAALPVN